MLLPANCSIFKLWPALRGKKNLSLRRYAKDGEDRSLFFSLSNAEKNEARLICNTVVVKSLPFGKRQIMHHGKKFLNGNMDFHSTKKKCSFMWMDDKLQRKKKCGRMPLNASLVSFPQCNMKCASVAGWVYNFRIFTMNLPWKIFSSFRFPRYF